MDIRDKAYFFAWVAAGTATTGATTGGGGPLLKPTFSLSLEKEDEGMWKATMSIAERG